MHTPLQKGKKDITQTLYNYESSALGSLQILTYIIVDVEIQSGNQPIEGFAFRLDTIHT